ncbi:MAG: amino acid ABC transporter substrate-binding protein [Gemmatimonadales bacterium]|nr:MAG: amino acid ABC transporter substrate-binding protein [Gemmatimonadales bacterium]
MPQFPPSGHLEAAPGVVRRCRAAPALRPVLALLAAVTIAGAGCGSDAGDPATGVPQPAAPVLDEGTRTDEAREDPRQNRPVLASPSELAVDQGDPLAAVRARGSGRVVVVYTPSDGWSYEDAGRRLTGVNVEILRDFFAWVEAREGVRLDVSWAADDDWARFYRRVRNGSEGVFGIGNVTITQERRGELDFSPPYLNNVAVLITHASVPELESLEASTEAFEGFTAYPYRGTLHEERINRLRERRIPGLRVIPLESNDEILGTIAEGPERLAFIDVHAYWRAMERGLPIRRHPAADDASETFGVVLPRGSDWTPLLEEFFEEGEGYRNRPRYLEILREHLGEGLTELLEEARLSREELAAPGPPPG